MHNIPDPIITKVTYNTQVEKVWEALTELRQMQKWYFEMLESFEAKVGFKTSFIVMVEDRKYTHQWEVTEVKTNQKIVYNWNIEEYDGASYSMFELKDKGNQTCLICTSVVTKPFPVHIPEFKRESGVQGWNFLLKKRLTEYLDNNVK